jgi:hypothetical protein
MMLAKLLSGAALAGIAVIAPRASVTLRMHYAVPATLPPGAVKFAWGLDPGGPFDASTAVQRASLSIVGQ